jgi:L-fucose mutarotase/ribose pyranase (RbsD/FucU family)
VVFYIKGGTMKLENEKKEVVYKYDIDCSDEEANQLKALAIERFSKDERAQMEYAIVSLLSDLVDKEETEDFLKDVIEKEKKRSKEDGSKSNDS